ncbi:MAG: hypothetical protein CVV21_05160 [Candidatus Goldiibacteriota bacterium HGW-Goldbacteria-1]|jgi:endonuclease G|nr:MAG: hypothetical protein CVV21_05160 [Candidatus Goldiibacteriota bacterium HGW-Goldbacteria-1]
MGLKNSPITGKIKVLKLVISVIAILMLISCTGLSKKWLSTASHGNYGIIFHEENSLNSLRWGYGIIYSKEKKQPLVVNIINNVELYKSFSHTAFSYMHDANFKSDEQANNLDYKSGDYVIGQMAFSHPTYEGGYEAKKEFYYFSNTCPQNKNFNKYVWKQVETEVLKKDCTVLTGPVFLDSNNERTKKPVAVLGKSKIWIPSHFFVIVITGGNNWDNIKTWALLLPNTDIDTISPDYSTTIEDIENKTGLTFLYYLSEDLQKKLKPIKNDWKIFVNN